MKTYARKSSALIALLIALAAIPASGCGQAAATSTTTEAPPEPTTPASDAPPAVISAVIKGAKLQYQSSGTSIEDAFCTESGFSASGKTYSCVLQYDGGKYTQSSDWTYMPNSGYAFPANS